MRKFHKYVFQFEVLSEEPILIASLLDLHEMTTDGHCSGRFLETRYVVLNGLECAQALRRQGSDPEFFRLTEKGEDTENA